VIWLALAALGIPLWMVAGALFATLWSRREFKRAPGVFSAKLRLVSGEVAGLTAAWPRRPLFARWVHDVLVIHRGLALVRSNALGVGRATGSLVAGDPDEVRGLGEEPVLLTLILDGGASVQLAAPSDDRDAMVGPFVGALLGMGVEGSAQD
jgi:hypothetical protein